MKHFELPEPDSQAKKHSRQLLDHIIQQIQLSGGQTSFEQYMQLALYAPGLGYYSAGSHKFGAQGDFITAPEISSLFGQVLAIQAQPLLEQIKNNSGECNLLEVGAGSGKMAADILCELTKRKALPDHYYILELSADLKQRQQQYLQTYSADYYSQIIWLDSLPENGFNGLVIANELLDAFPVHLLMLDKNQLFERFVCIDPLKKEDSEQPLCFKDVAIDNPELLAFKDKLQNTLKPNQDLLDKDTAYITEINLLASQWIKSLAQRINQGALLLIDYGYPQSEYFHPQRHMGTLMCHYRHLGHDNPFFFPGLQDITAHVNFSEIKYAAESSGLELSGYTTQAHFLLAGGLAELIQHVNINEIKQHDKMVTEIKKLTLPNEMGELFKVIYLTKNIHCPLSGFSFKDMRDKL